AEAIAVHAGGWGERRGAGPEVTPRPAMVACGAEPGGVEFRSIVEHTAVGGFVVEPGHGRADDGFVVMGVGAWDLVGVGCLWGAVGVVPGGWCWAVLGDGAVVSVVDGGGHQPGGVGCAELEVFQWVPGGGCGEVGGVGVFGGAVEVVVFDAAGEAVGLGGADEVLLCDSGADSICEEVADEEFDVLAFAV